MSKSCLLCNLRLRSERCFDCLTDEYDVKLRLFQEYAKRYLTRNSRVEILKDASSVHAATSKVFDADHYLFNCNHFSPRGIRQPLRR